MGIYDRDYARAGRRGAYSSRGGGLGGPFAGMRFWSFNTWLIILNVLVFASDAVLASRGVTVECKMGTFSLQGVNLRDHQTVVSPQVVPPDATPPQVRPFPAHPILDRNTNAVIGLQAFERMPPLTAFGHFSSGRLFQDWEIWRVVTFQFLHANLNHLLMNMLALWFFGPLVERSIGSRSRYAAFYLTCGIFGAVSYLILNLLGVIVTQNYMPLVGASAGCFGVLMAAAYYAGDGIMLVFMVLPMKIRTGAYLFVLLAVLNILMGGGNAGGDAAHIGGAIAGYFFVRRPHLLTDFFDILGSSKTKRPPRRGGIPASPRPAAGTDPRLDAILGKIATQGMGSLSDEDRQYLERARRGG
ncbi:MAG TPA: rhomboid family intramembrane serine protease [Phycisphaerales bacterium]|nr:rhomboid family intramembrane serine protease [Phycisphaerales bacterium]